VEVGERLSDGQGGDGRQHARRGEPDGGARVEDRRQHERNRRRDREWNRLSSPALAKGAMGDCVEGHGSSDQAEEEQPATGSQLQQGIGSSQAPDAAADGAVFVEISGLY
jgi:hypothetical protein